MSIGGMQQEGRWPLGLMVLREGAGGAAAWGPDERVTLAGPAGSCWKKRGKLSQLCVHPSEMPLLLPGIPFNNKSHKAKY